MADTGNAVAIYWDFENVHACLLDQVSGAGTYRSTAKFRAQEPIVDIPRVVDYAAGFGRVAVHRAYANWQHFARYKESLQAHAIDLVQLYPLAGGKNGADIRLALDVAEDLRLQPGITHVVVVSSDSDFTPLAQRCRAYGRQFVGVGTARFIAAAYPCACDAFRRYQELPPGQRPAALTGLSGLSGGPIAAAGVPEAAPAGRGDAGPGLSEARFTPAAGFTGAGLDWAGPEATRLSKAGELVVAAIRRQAAEHGGPWVLKAAVRPMVRRLDPAFDEAALGFANFTDLLAALDEWITVRKGRFDHELAVRADLTARRDAALIEEGASQEGAGEEGAGEEGGPGAEAAAGLAAPGAAGILAGDDGLDALEPATPVSLVEWQLKKKKQRLPLDRRLLWSGPGLIADIFAAAETGVEPGFDSLFVKFGSAAAAIGLTVRETEFRKLKAILWRAFAFQPLPDGQGLRLRVPDGVELRLRMVVSLLRLLPDPANADPSVLAEALFGPGATAEQRSVVCSALANLRGPGNGIRDLLERGCG